MSNVVVCPSVLKGKVQLPSSKSHTIRALLFAHKAQGISHIQNPLVSPDTDAMLQAISTLGSTVEKKGSSLWIAGGKDAAAPASPIDCGNSGQILRFLGALAALSPRETQFFGDASLCSLRPVQPLLDGLNQLSASARSLGKSGYAPIAVSGPLRGGKAHILGSDSQPVSGLLFAAALAPHPTELLVADPGETAWIELSLSWLRRLDLPYEREGYTRYRLEGGGKIAPFSYTVPADWSTAAFPLAAALLTRSELTLGPLDFDDAQGDKKIVPLLEEMGARLERDGSFLHVFPSSLKGASIDVNPFIDALPILAALACFAEGETLLYNGAIARKKESDRIAAMACELKKMGADIEERPDGLKIRPSPLFGAGLFSHQDHRIALSLAVAALGARGESRIEGFEAAAKSYPNFLEDFRALGAKMEAV